MIFKKFNGWVFTFFKRFFPFGALQKIYALILFTLFLLEPLFYTKFILFINEILSSAFVLLALCLKRNLFFHFEILSFAFSINPQLTHLYPNPAFQNFLFPLEIKNLVRRNFHHSALLPTTADFMCRCNFEI